MSDTRTEGAETQEEPPRGASLAERAIANELVVVRGQLAAAVAEAAQLRADLAACQAAGQQVRGELDELLADVHARALRRVRLKLVRDALVAGVPTPLGTVLAEVEPAEGCSIAELLRLANDEFLGVAE